MQTIHDKHTINARGYLENKRPDTDMTAYFLSKTIYSELPNMSAYSSFT